MAGRLTNHAVQCILMHDVIDVFALSSKSAAKRDLA